MVAATAILAAALLAGCTSTHHPSSRASTPTPSSAARLSAQGLIDESWASNGKRGFFIDAAGPTGGSMSLYDTAWWTRVLVDGGKPLTGLRASAVGQWLVPLLDGSADGSADSSTMPRIAVLEAAVNLATSLHLDFPRQAVAERVESLRVGPMYRSSPTAKTGDWGTTAAAIGVLREIGASPPQIVTSNLAAQIHAAITVRSRKQVLSFVIPVLSTMTAAQVRSAGTTLDDQLTWIESQLPDMTALERLSAASGTRPVLAAAGRRSWSAAEVCGRLDTADGGVRAGPNTGVDAQVTAIAIEAGCHVDAAPPPWTSAGWPDDQAISGAVPASVAGLRIAYAVGSTKQFLAAIRAQLSDVWLARTTGSDVDPAALIMLCHLTSVTPPASLQPTDVSAAVAASADGQSLAALLIGWLQHLKATAPSALAPSAGVANVFEAAADELKFRLTGDNRFHAAAQTVLSKLAVTSNLYAVSPGTSGSTAPPSVVATAIASWIMGTPLPSAALQRAGLCDSQMSCGRGGRNSPIDSPLRATAAVAAILHPDQASFPIAV